MSSRERLLAKLRAQRLPAVELPPLAGPWTRHSERGAAFRAALLAAAGRVVETDAAALRQTILGLDEVRTATRRRSFVEGVFDADPGAPPLDARAFFEVELVVAPAAFGVAENGAVWVDRELVPIRAALFACEHLVLTLPRAALVDTLHDAYERLGARAGRAGYGCFISGPSKTADIEQQLIIGAHGPRSLTVVLR